MGAKSLRRAKARVGIGDPRGGKATTLQGRKKGNLTQRSSLALSCPGCYLPFPSSSPSSSSFLD